MDAVVADPYGLDPVVRESDYVIAREIESSLFPVLCEVLNRFHQTTHSERYWKILLGHWFRRYVSVLINRYQTLATCLSAYRISGVAVFSHERTVLVPQNSYDAILAFNDSCFNERLYVLLLSYVDTQGLEVEQLEATDGPAAAIAGIKHPPQRSRKSFMARFYGFLYKLANHCASERDSVIIGSYLPILDELRLYVALGQFPQLYARRIDDLPLLPVDTQQRRMLTGEMTKAIDPKESDMLKAMRRILFEVLPVCYLEGYSQLVEVAQGLLWPDKPGFIFTSNNFDADELFKIWAANKVADGVPYFTGQHGNNYGTHRYMNPSIEEATADKFITWGWTDGLMQHVPGFIFKARKKRMKAYDSKGGLLLVELHAGLMLNTWDVVAEHARYFDEQLQFVACLDSHVREQLTVRLHSYSNLGWNEVARWHAFDPAIRLETGKSKIAKLNSASRLVVQSYDSTGILETLSQNIPTLAFWQDGFAHLRESALPYYEQLREAGIVHLSPTSAAAHINAIWDNVDSWWASLKVQEARQRFCDRYAHLSSSPVDDMKKILLNCAAE
jgi:putative transferase (TIGR04331 family)